MLTNNEQGRALINSAAYAIISEKAPHELPLYVSYRDSYFANPKLFLETPQTKDEALGFGTSIHLEAFSQVVFPILSTMLTLLIQEAVKAMGKDTGTSAVKWLQGLFDKKPNDKAPTFTSKQLAEIKKELDKIADKESRCLNIKKPEIEIIRDALLARLALHNS
ncbi:MAG: hypothetical protein CL608_32430 [Anaerolineaceae bacterium]|nr:hypothetical protein [Anaerolineaceae bacterium]